MFRWETPYAYGFMWRMGFAADVTRWVKRELFHWGGGIPSIAMFQTGLLEAQVCKYMSPSANNNVAIKY